jgi:putative adhesin
MARPLLALGGIVLIGVGVAIALGWGLGSSVERDTKLAQPIHSVKLAADSGDVKIRVGTGPASVHQKLHYNFRSAPNDDAFRVEGDQLVLGSCGRNCTADFDVVVPAGVPVTGSTSSGGVDITGVASVDVSADSGDAKVENVAGLVKLTLDSGSIDLRDVGGVQAHSDSGHVSGDGLRGPVDVSSDSGSVDLTLAQPSDVKVKADSGSVDLRVPGGSYRVIGDSDSGSRSIDIPQGTSEVKTLDLNTSSGSVSVKAA